MEWGQTPTNMDRGNVWKLGFWYIIHYLILISLNRKRSFLLSWKSGEKNLSKIKNIRKIWIGYKTDIALSALSALEALSSKWWALIMRAIEIIESLSLMILIWWCREKKGAMEIASQWVDASHFHLSCTIKHINCLLYFLKLPKFLPLLISTGELFWGDLFCEDVLELVLNVLTWEPEAMELEACYYGQSSLSCW